MPAKLGENPLESVTLRLDTEKYRAYETAMSLAKLGSAEAVRQALERSLEKFNQVDLAGLKIDSEFTPKMVVAGRDTFPELVGHIRLTVTPPENLCEDRLSQMIFVLPEFFDAKTELYRVDNAHYQRIVVNDKHVASKKARSRAVLSFRLINGKWSGSVFDYSGAGAETIVKAVVDAMKNHIIATIKCELIEQLPPSRHLTASEVADLNALHLPHMMPI